MKEIILQFLEKYGIKTSEDEDSATTELYMDDHTYIEFAEQGYYLPKNNSSYTEDDELILEYLNYHYDFMTNNLEKQKDQQKFYNLIDKLFKERPQLFPISKNFEEFHNEFYSENTQHQLKEFIKTI